MALESTIISHGMPYPQNLELSQELAYILREKGVEPATIAIKNGRPCVGLSVEELRDLAVARGDDRAQKISTREVCLLMGRAAVSDPPPKPFWGATTVASTMVLAARAGIPTFVTGGIGGVHREVEDSMDISADLLELARTPVVVVSAGIKSILDIPRTLEVLETNSVPVVSYQTDNFPAFFSPSSGVASPFRVDDVNTIAAAYHAARELQLNHGMLVAVPNNVHSANGADLIKQGQRVEDAIQEALQEASQDTTIHGKDVTPFLLKRVSELTDGDSLHINMALVKNNAYIGADIAVALSGPSSPKSSLAPDSGAFDQVSSMSPPSNAEKVIVVMGGLVLDVMARPAAKLLPKTSNPATCHESDGGVGRNIAEGLGRLDNQTLLYSVVGEDARGDAMLARLAQTGVINVDDTVTRMAGQNTAIYLAILEDDGDMSVACADMDILQNIPEPPGDVLERAGLLVMDANAPLQALERVAVSAKSHGCPIFFEPTSVPKARLVALNDVFMSCLTYASPNLNELWALADGWTTSEEDHESMELSGSDLYDFVRPLAESVLGRMNEDEAHLFVTLGAQGVVVFSKKKENVTITLNYFAIAQEVTTMVNATGAGDSFAAGVCHELLRGSTLEQAVQSGMKIATMSLSSPSAISPLVSPSSLV